MKSRISKDTLIDEDLAARNTEKPNNDNKLIINASKDEVKSSGDDEVAAPKDKGLQKEESQST